MCNNVACTVPTRLIVYRPHPRPTPSHPPPPSHPPADKRVCPEPINNNNNVFFFCFQNTWQCSRRLILWLAGPGKGPKNHPPRDNHAPALLLLGAKDLARTTPQFNGPHSNGKNIIYERDPPQNPAHKEIRTSTWRKTIDPGKRTYRRGQKNKKKKVIL